MHAHVHADAPTHERVHRRTKEHTKMHNHTVIHHPLALAEREFPRERASDQMRKRTATDRRRGRGGRKERTESRKRDQQQEGERESTSSLLARDASGGDRTQPMKRASMGSGVCCLPRRLQAWRAGIDTYHTLRCTRTRTFFVCITKRLAHTHVHTCLQHRQTLMPVECTRRALRV